MSKTGISKLQAKQDLGLQLRKPDVLQIGLRHRIGRLQAINQVQPIDRQVLIEPQLLIELQLAHQHQIGQHQIGQLHQVHLIGLLGQDQWAHHVLLQVQVVHLQVQVVHLVRVQPGLEVEDDIDFFTY